MKIKKTSKVILMMMVLTILISVVVYAGSKCTYYPDGNHKFVACEPLEKIFPRIKRGIAEHNGVNEFYIDHYKYVVDEVVYICPCGEKGVTDYINGRELFCYREWTGAVE